MRLPIPLLLAACAAPPPSAADPDMPDPADVPAGTTTAQAPGTTTTSTSGTGGSSGSTTDPGTGTSSGTAYVTVDPSTLPPGLGWVRANEPFVSGLVVNLGAPPADEVTRYFDDFHATAVHLWTTALPDEVDGWAAVNHPSFRWLCWLDMDGINPVSGVGVGDVPVVPGRIGYQVWDEPADYAAVDAMLPGVERVRQEDPDALVVINFGNPDDGIDPRDLYTYAIQLLDPDVIAYDLYSSSRGEYERAGLIRELALDHDLAYWRYINSYGDGSRDEPGPVDLRWAATLGLVYGYTGHTWFLYETDPVTAQTVYTTLFDGVGSWDHVPNADFQVVADLNLELRTYARTVNLLTSTDVRYVPQSVLYMPEDTPVWAPGAGGDPWLTAVESVSSSLLQPQEWAVGFFEDDNGERYFMVQNAARPLADWPLYRPQGDLRLEFDFAGAPANLDTTRLRRLDPATGQVVDEPLTWLGGPRAELVRTLDAGDVVLFKYATGAPFAQMP